MPLCFRSPLLSVIGASLALVLSIPAQENVTAVSTPDPVEETDGGKWSGPDISDGFDWLEFTSGEWLKGEIKSIQDDTLEFESDQLDDLTIDWEDVRQLITDNNETVSTEDKRLFTGAIRIDEEWVRVIDSAGLTNSFARSELLGLVQGEPREINYWSFKAGAGVTFQTGNTKRSEVNLNAFIERRTPNTRFYLKYLGIASTTDDVETANNHRVNGVADIFITRRFFVRPLSLEYYKDKFQNIDHQITVGLGAGYTIIDNGTTEWDFFAGPGYRYTRFLSVQPGEAQEESTPAFLAGTTWDRELTAWLDADATYNFTLLNERSGTFTHHATAGLEIELTSMIDLDLSVIWDRIQTPQQRADGTTPEQDDLRVIFGFSLDI